MTIPAITIQQPYASLIAVGAKKYETRSWQTNYRGKIAIHAGKKKADVCMTNCGNVDFALGFEGSCDWYKLPYGAVVAVADLIGCWKTTEHTNFYPKGSRLFELVGRISDNTLLSDRRTFIPNWEDENEILFGDFSPGRYAWELANVHPLAKPITCRGRQGLFNVDTEVICIE
jgi:hypothetical protein